MTKAIVTTMPHTTDGARRNDIRVNDPIPISEPTRSQR